MKQPLYYLADAKMNIGSIFKGKVKITGFSNSTSIGFSYRRKRKSSGFSS